MPSVPTLPATNPEIPALQVTGAALTDAGSVRPSNEDSVALVIPESTTLLLRRGVLAMVADGMGGHEGGEVASGIAVSTLSQAYYASAGEHSDPQAALAEAFAAANQAIYSQARKRSELTGMGTTCTAVAIVNARAYCAHAGDSRAYLIRAGQAYCMTEDHSATMELVKQGLLTHAEARHHEDRNVILRAMGTHKTLKAEHWSPPFPLRPSDRLLLCSDGLYEMLSDDELAHFTSTLPPAAACQELIALAKARVCSDNVSAIVLTLSGAVGEEDLPR
jgi:PPM family protein phosphatase